MFEDGGVHASPHMEPEASSSRGSLESQLRGYRDLVDRLLEEVPAGFLSVDDGLRITFINRTAERTWGFRREELVGRGLWEVFPDAATPAVTNAMIRLAETGAPVQFETFHEPTRKWIQVFAFRLSDGFSAFFVDVTEHRLAEIERQDAEARYRDMVEQVPAITYLDAAVEGRTDVHYVSPQSKTILGYSPEEWRLNPNLWIERLHPDDRDATVEEDERCRRLGTPFEAEYRMIARDGRVVWFHDRGAPLLDETGRPKQMHGVMLDITASRAAEEVIRRKDSVLAAVGFAAERLLRSASWEAVIDEVLARLGSASDVDRVDLFELRNPDDGDVRASSRAEWYREGGESVHERVQGVAVPWMAPWLPALRSGQSLVATAGCGRYQIPQRLGYASSAVAPLLVGSELWGILSLGESKPEREWSAPELEAVGGVAAAVAAAIGRERTQHHLRESEERFRRLAEEAPDVIFRYQLRPTPGIEYVSPAVEQMLGYSPEEILASPEIMLKLIHPDDLPLLQGMMTSFHDSPTLRWVARGGGIVWTEHRTSPVLDDDGRLIAVEGIVRDVTERVRTEETLRESFQALSRANDQRKQLLARLVKAQEEERQRVANDIHDDSIQIMTAVGLRLAVLRSQFEDPAAERTLTSAEETVALAIQRLRRLLFELHPMSLDSSGLAAAISDYACLMEEDGGPELLLDDRLDAEPPVESRTILYRIAQEALANVRKHARAAHVWVTLWPEGGGVRVKIRDDGIGFDLASRPNSGLGHVGMPSMRERAALAGGWMRIDSAPGAGTTVDYWIPRLVAAAAAAAATAWEAAPTEPAGPA
jgi:PAS domain S-box-containing protein